MIDSAERISFQSHADAFVYHKQFKAYEYAIKEIKGRVLEVGSGDGYGLKFLAPQCESYVALDKFKTNFDASEHKNVEFIQTNLPPLSVCETDSFDYVICFQVIEHIESDSTLIKEIGRVLKPGGKLLMTTPNIKMTLSRNPFHIREYTIEGLKGVLEEHFNQVEMKGVFGDNLVMDYYEKNKQSVNAIMKYDFLNLQYRLPSWLLKIPYEIVNKMNRKHLAQQNEKIVSEISTKNYIINEAESNCLDLLAIAIA